MKTIKNLLLSAITIIVLSFTTFSQVGGFTFQSDRIAYESEGYDNFYEANDIFSLSIKDEFLFHIVVNNDGMIIDSQVYKLLSIDIKIDQEDGFITIKFTVLSGKSGMRFDYELLVDSDNRGVLISDQKVAFGGNPTILSTYKQ